MPVLIAASGPRLLALAAREADIVAFGWPPETTEDAALQSVRARARRGGERFDDLELAAGLIAVGTRNIRGCGGWAWTRVRWPRRARSRS